MLTLVTRLYFNMRTVNKCHHKEWGLFSFYFPNQKLAMYRGSDLSAASLYSSPQSYLETFLKIKEALTEKNLYEILPRDWAELEEALQAWLTVLLVIDFMCICISLSSTFELGKALVRIEFIPTWPPPPPPTAPLSSNLHFWILNLFTPALSLPHPYSFGPL